MGGRDVKMIRLVELGWCGGICRGRVRGSGGSFGLK